MFKKRQSSKTLWSLPRSLIFVAILSSTTGCQMSYLLKNAAGQFKIITSHQNIDDLLKNSTLDPALRAKLELSKEAKKFAEKEMHLVQTANYTTYVDLQRPYVSYVVSAAEKWQLKPFVFKYPIFGSMPYKGYFDPKDAENEAKELQQKNLDTYLRGVSAYSTLGWLRDPVLSSMTKYEDRDFVNTIIHETVHATIYIKNNADFNERLATYLGNHGAEKFYLMKEGPSSPTAQKIRDEIQDDHLFSEFIGRELNDLKKWYDEKSEQKGNEEERSTRLNEIKDRFYTIVYPRLKSKKHYGFNKLPLNNARLLVFKTYMENLNNFAELMLRCQDDYSCFMTKIKSLEKSQDPEKELIQLISGPPSR